MRQDRQLGKEAGDFKAGNQIEMQIASIASIPATIHIVWTKVGGALDVTVEEVVISARKKVVVFAKSWTQYAHGCKTVLGMPIKSCPLFLC